MDTNSKSWLDRLLGACVVLAVSAWLLHLAWNFLRPLLPVGLGLAAVALVIAVVVRYQHDRFL